MSDSIGDAKSRRESSVLAKVRNCLVTLQDWMDDSSVTDIMINRPDDVWIQQGGRKFCSGAKISASQIEAAITLLASNSGITVSNESADAIVSTKLPGFRVEATLPPVAVDGPTISFRRNNMVVMAMEDWVKQGALPAEVADFLADVVRKRLGVAIVGSTGSGKTTFANTLLGCYPENDRIITIEQVPELVVKAPNRVRLQINPQLKVTAKRLLESVLRQNPDRIVLGEARGAEANDLLQAANTGHPGPLVTLHANNGKEGLTRFEDMVAQSSDAPDSREGIQVRIAAAFQVMVFMTLVGDDRIVAEVVSVDGYNRQSKEYETKLIYRSSRYETFDVPTLGLQRDLAEAA
ncbi:ATPase, T2SS/T4P/T4SS family [Ralstonia insidiosa]|nr:CpaF family protein [Ralstonia insidiosa]MBA9939804.1 CpaF family protein [Ralstonia insidiosa]MBC9968471.1 CpaF family protein [Ralstonia insidiosa]MBX3904708.1 Flp pilus assembly complex ATPase component TadA [Ralstonia insidiosa]